MTDEKPHILLCVTGCVQAEVTPRMVANLLYHPDIGHHEVIVAATYPALQFFEKSNVEALVKRPVFIDHQTTTEEFPVPHINLVEWADLILVYPASANTIAKCANGMTDSLVSNLVLAADCPVYFGPTMNKRMFENPITQGNLRQLKKAGYHLIPQEMCDVVVRATGKMEKKLYCSEAMVLHIVDQVLHANISERTTVSA